MSDTLHVAILLDRSGSMQDAKADHEGGIRSFIDDQRKLSGDVRFSLIQFDTNQPCEVVYDDVPLADVKDIVLTPRGGTPLLEAVGLAVAHLRAKITDPNVVFMIVTDGGENASKPDWNRARVKAALEEVEKIGWSVLYLGANQDAFAEAGAMGMGASASMNYTNTGPAVQNVYAVMSNKVGGVRARSAQGMPMGMAMASSYMAYDESERTSASTGETTTTTGGVSVPLVLTNAMKSSLRSLGYNEGDIYLMTPQAAWDLINANTTKGGNS
jgi:hypothetical protein